MSAIRKKRKAFVDQEDCVACGCCVKVCPLGAIQIMKALDTITCLGLPSFRAHNTPCYNVRFWGNSAFKKILLFPS